MFGGLETKSDFSRCGYIDKRMLSLDQPGRRSRGRPRRSGCRERRMQRRGLDGGTPAQNPLTPLKSEPALVLVLLMLRP